MNKKYFFIIIVSCIVSVQLNAQSFSDNIPFSKFKSWASSIHFDGMDMQDLYEEGDAEANDSVTYSATYASANKRISISMMDMDSYDYYLSNAQEDFYQDGFRLLYHASDQASTASFLSITNSDIQGFITIASMPKLSKEEMVKLYEQIDISKLLF